MLKARHLNHFGNPTPRNSQDVFCSYISSHEILSTSRVQTKKSKTLQYSWIKRGRYYNSSCNTMLFCGFNLRCIPHHVPRLPATWQFVLYCLQSCKMPAATTQHQSMLGYLHDINIYIYMNTVDKFSIPKIPMKPGFIFITLQI